MNRRIILIGFSAVGKTTVGRLVADALGWRFVDTDPEVCRRVGKTMREIFHGEGEQAFREYEYQLLRELCRQSDVVIAGGGGIVLAERARRLIHRACYVVCLEARPETLHARLLRDRESNPVARLLTTGADPVGRIAYLKQYRQPYYAIADWTVHTDDLTPADAAAEVLHGWQFHCQAQQATAAKGAKPVLHYPLGDALESDAPYDIGL